MNFIARRVSGTSVGVLTTWRLGHTQSAGDLARSDIELRPLDDAAASLLLAGRCPALPPRVVERLVGAAAGSPLALTELPGLLSAAQRTGRAELPSVLPTGTRLRSMFAGQIAALSAAGRYALIVAALNDAGVVTSQRELAGRPGRHALDPVGLLQESEAAGLVTADNGYARVTFRHPLVAATVVGMSTELERRRAHRAIARVAATGSFAQIWHLAQAAVAQDEALAADLERAARCSLRGGDGREAALALARAAELSPEPSSRRRRLAVAAYVRADVTGELGQASSLLAEATDEPADPGGFDRAAPGSGPPGAHPAVDRAARGDDRLMPDPSPQPPSHWQTPLSVTVARAYVLLHRDGDLAGAHADLVAALQEPAALVALADPAGASPELSEALHALMLTCFFRGEPALWTPFSAALGQLGRRAPRMVSMCADALADPVRRGSRALSDLDAHIAALHLRADPTTVVRTAMAALYLDRSAACREALARVAADGRAGGATGSAVNAVIILGFDAFAAGDWPLAQRYFEEGLGESARLGLGLLRWPARFGMALLAAARGDVAEVDSIAGDMSSWAVQRTAGQVQIYADHVRALSALGAGDPAAALRHLASINKPGQFAPINAHALWIMLDTVESAVAAGRPEIARAHVAAMGTAAVAALSPRYAMVALAAEALVSPPTHAMTLFDAALSVPGADRWPFDWARTQLLFGEHLHRRRETVSAGQHLRAAYDVFARLHADPWVRRAAAGLRATGENVPLVRGAPSIVHLTPHEIRIANYAAAGLTNKQIAARCRTSHRSVGSVLSRVFQALAITSRAALGETLARSDVRITE